MFFQIDKISVRPVRLIKTPYSCIETPSIGILIQVIHEKPRSPIFVHRCFEQLTSWYITDESEWDFQEIESAEVPYSVRDQILATLQIPGPAKSVQINF